MSLSWSHRKQWMKCDWGDVAGKMLSNLTSKNHRDADQQTHTHKTNTILNSVLNVRKRLCYHEHINCRHARCSQVDFHDKCGWMPDFFKLPSLGDTLTFRKTNTFGNSMSYQRTGWHVEPGINPPTLQLIAEHALPPEPYSHHKHLSALQPWSLQKKWVSILAGPCRLHGIVTNYQTSELTISGWYSWLVRTQIINVAIYHGGGVSCLQCNIWHEAIASIQCWCALYHLCSRITSIK